MPTLYTLQLQDGHYYIGRTERDAYDEWIQHVIGAGSKWTTIYKPINIKSIRKNVLPNEELACLRNYYDMYGYSYVHTDELLCYRCGFAGHYSKTCNAIWHANGFNIDEAEGAIAR